MRPIKAFALGLAMLVGFVMTLPALAATNEEIAVQVRTSWANARAAYLASVQPYQSVAASATIISQYTAATDKAGTTLEQYITLKLASPATTSTVLTPVVDQLYKDLLAMKAVRNKATGALGTALANALTQQNQITQTALSNMR